MRVYRLGCVWGGGGGERDEGRIFFPKSSQHAIGRGEA